MAVYDKKWLRDRLRVYRNSLSSTEIMYNSRVISDRLAKIPEFLGSEHLAFYHAVGSEINLQELVKLSKDMGKGCYFPRIKQDELILDFVASTGPSYTNSYGIVEHKGEAFSLAKLNIIFVPLLGFDQACNRLGMGKGHYDRTFAGLGLDRPLLIGVAHAGQLVDSLPVEEHDIKLDMVVTESKIYY